MRASKRSVSANHNERVEPSSSQGLQCPPLPGIGGEFRSASAAQKSAGGLDDASDIARAQLDELCDAVCVD